MSLLDKHLTSQTTHPPTHPLNTQVTAVARPDVDVGGVEALAKKIGADFRARAYFH